MDRGRIFGSLRVGINTRRQYRQRASALSEALTVQQIAIENFELEDGKGEINGAALGYIYGFVDAGLQVGGLDITTDYGVRALLRVLANFARHRAKVYRAFLDENMPRDARVMNGVMMGGRECKMWLVSDYEPIPGLWRQCFSSSTEGARRQSPPRHSAGNAGRHGVATAAANSYSSHPGAPAADVAVGSG
jgi:hypothetical protein